MGEVNAMTESGELGQPQQNTNQTSSVSTSPFIGDHVAHTELGQPIPQAESIH